MSNTERTCPDCGGDKIKTYTWHDGAVSKDCPCGWREYKPASETNKRSLRTETNQ